MNEALFACEFFVEAYNKKYPIELCKKGEAKDLPQVDFGHKKLHYYHVLRLFKHFIEQNNPITHEEFGKIVPGRPCDVKCFREITAEILRKYKQKI